MEKKNQNTKEVKYSNKYIYIFIRFVYYIGGSPCDPPNCAAGSPPPPRRTKKYYIFYVLFRGPGIRFIKVKVREKKKKCAPPLRVL